MERAAGSFLRKQESSLLYACYGVPAGQAETVGYFSGFPFVREGDPSAGLSRQGSGKLLHSAQVLPFWIPTFVGMTRWVYPPRGEAGCTIRLKCYHSANVLAFRRNRPFSHPA